MYWDKNHRRMREAFCLYQPEVSLGKVNMKEQWEQVTGNLFESGSRKAKSWRWGKLCLFGDRFRSGNSLPFATFHEGMKCSGG